MQKNFECTICICIEEAGTNFQSKTKVDKQKKIFSLFSTSNYWKPQTNDKPTSLLHDRSFFESGIPPPPPKLEGIPFFNLSDSTGKGPLSPEEPESLFPHLKNKLGSSFNDRECQQLGFTKTIQPTHVRRNALLLGTKLFLTSNYSVKNKILM